MKIKLFTILLWVPVILTGVIAVPQNSVSILFRDSVLVTGPDVCLGEIALISGGNGEQCEKLKSIIVSKSLIPGHIRIVSTDYIIGYCMQGQPVKTFKFRNRGNIAVLMDQQKISSRQIEKSVKAYVLANIPWGKENISIRFTRCPKQVVLANLPYRIKIENSMSFDYRGTGKLRIFFLQKERAVKSIYVSMDISVSTYVCVAVRKISRKTIISPEDIIIKKVNISRMRNKPFSEAVKLVGKRSIRTIPAGRVFDNAMVEDRPIVDCGSRVRLLVQKGGTIISADAIARSHGYVGEIIPVFCMATRKILKGRIQRDGDVLVKN